MEGRGSLPGARYVAIQPHGVWRAEPTHKEGAAGPSVTEGWAPAPQKGAGYLAFAGRGGLEEFQSFQFPPVFPPFSLPSSLA